MKKITGENNPCLKEYRKLSSGKDKKQGKVTVEGFNLLEEAIKQGFTLETFFYAPELAPPEQLAALWERLSPETGIIELPPRLFKKIALTENSPGVAGIIQYPDPPWNRILARVSSPAILVDRLQDPGNLGTVMRSLAAAGGRNLFYVPGSVYPFNHKVMRSSAGALFHLRIKKCEQPGELIRNLKEKGVAILAADSKSGKPYYRLNLTRPFLLVIGNEREGISSPVKRVADEEVTIPLEEGLDSLNASVAAAVILFEAQRQKWSDSPG